MCNLLKSDFYKLIRSKSLKICWLIVLFFAVIVPIINNAVMDQIEKQINSNGSITMPIYDGFHAIFDSFSGAGNILIILAILVPIYVSSEFTNGTMKNIASKSFTRTQIYLSKLIVMLIVNTIIMISFVAVSTVTSTILWGFGEPTKDALFQILRLFGLEILLFCGLTALFNMISMLIKNVGGSIAVSICILIFTEIIILILHTFVFKDTDISKFWIVYNTSTISALKLTSESIRIALINGIGFIIIPTIFGCYMFNKKDIK